ncbi:hypothetical protein EMQ25_01675 [Arsenicitalea aurantiaca]|uniref:ABC transmembrane type-1 domain-containing protein n=1 Tax=Arsenicitalea aurantiaca TaxID=1783274 RepID=A0A433XL22_9HYPH|nr:hypothetical protein [Arsenicitalea aurantiaca]RUT34698.1 hypothetical protein EMQ25_01675 [Arsenicitalea aurantiaca]
MPPSAERLSRPYRPFRLAAGAGLSLAILGLVILVLSSILRAAGAEGESAALRVDIPHLLRMSAIQAGLSTALSLFVGLLIAWALNRLRFFGRDLVIALFATAIVTPGVVVAFGLLTIWGRNGWINRTLEALLDTGIGNPIFGLGGILLAHVTLNGAFAARILLARLDAIPAARLKTGQSLGLGAFERFRIIDWPMLRGTLPGLGAIIFLLCFTSFPIVLLLGGGPANQTLEVAIYSAVRLDFDLRGAVVLALVQIIVCSGIILATTALSPVPASTGPSRAQTWADGTMARLLQWLVLGLGLGAFALPLIVVIVDGLGPGLGRVIASSSFWSAAIASVAIGLASATLTLALALALGLGRAAATDRWLKLVLGLPAFAYLAVPAIVLALGFFLFVRDMGVSPTRAAPIVLVLANALLALPFAIATLGPPLEALASSRGRLIRALDIGGFRQFQLLEWPLLARDMGVVFALAFCFSLGDLGVISLFGTDSFSTLPLLMVRALGAYRTNDAAVIAALILLLTLFAFLALPRLFAWIANARSR